MNCSKHLVSNKKNSKGDKYLLQVVLYYDILCNSLTSDYAYNKALFSHVIMKIYSSKLQFSVNTAVNAYFEILKATCYLNQLIVLIMPLKLLL